MLRFVARRLLQIVPVLFVIITATFFMVRFVPGGPFTAEKAIPPEILKNLEAHYGLDQPLWRQYVTYLGNIVRGDFGPSFKYANRSVNEIIAQKLPVSLELGGWAMLVALGLGLPLGIFAAARQNTWLDYACSTTGMIGICVPTFVLGPVLALVFGIHLQWLNVSGWDAATDRILPGVTLGFVYAAYIMRLTRGGMLEVLNQDFIRTARAKGASEARVIFRHALRGGLLEVLNQDFIRTARAKGASEARVIFRHALRGGLLPVVSFLGPAIAGILTGSFVIETIFQIPGLGREFVNSAFNRDYLLVLGTVILYATLLIVMNLVVDVVQVWLNPKLKFE
jgi:oligopeptide transport system permease protein